MIFLETIVNLTKDMVNTFQSSTKSRFLEQLRQKREIPISGEELALTIGVSRVTIWKTAKSLIAAGYPLSVDATGYRIGKEASDDLLYPWEFKNYEELIHYWDTTTSTMDRARELAEKGAPAGTIVVAESQTAGRGRSGRTWDSQRGGLFFTVIRRERIPIIRYAREGMRAAVSIADAISRTIGKKPKLRWPNDLYIKDRKISGVLTELRGDGDRVKWTLVGIGVNVNNLGDRAKSISCSEIAGKHISRRLVLSAFVEAFKANETLADINPAYEWNSLAFGRGSHVAVLSAEHATQKNRADCFTSGIFEGIDELGRAIIKTDTGTELIDPGTGSLAWN